MNGGSSTIIIISISHVSLMPRGSTSPFSLGSFIHSPSRRGFTRASYYLTIEYVCDVVLERLCENVFWKTGGCLPSVGPGEALDVGKGFRLRSYQERGLPGAVTGMGSRELEWNEWNGTWEWNGR
jgi:hypothetical protein